MKKALLFLGLLSLPVSAQASEQGGLPWKQGRGEVEVRTGLPIPGAQTTLRYASPSEIDGHHALTAYIGPSFTFDRDASDFWLLPQIGFRAKIDQDRLQWHPEAMVAVWGRASFLRGLVSYELQADAAIGLYFSRTPDFDLRHRLDLNFFIPTGSSDDDFRPDWSDGFSAERSRGKERDPRRLDHWLVRAGVHAEQRNLLVDVGPGVTFGYHGITVSADYLLGFQKENRGQTVMLRVGTEFFL